MIIVGLGASAGGLEALEQFFTHVPADTGISFVVLQHLEPHRPSLLAELLSRRACIPVTEAVDGQRPERNHAFIAPPGAMLSLKRGAFKVTAADHPGAHGLIDLFFSSLASARGEQAVAILLSGAGHDGTAGLHAIRAHGGLTLAQAPETARHSSMVQSAIEAGLVDHVLPPAELASLVLDHAGYMTKQEVAEPKRVDARWAEHLTAICALITLRTGHDFSRYKDGTLRRRIRRRMQILRLPTLEAYVARLTEDSAEAESLVRDLLIGVTQFFRDPETFETLGRLVIPGLMPKPPVEGPVRIWVPGCASGEEAYSIAILVLEHLARSGTDCPVQIFASDMDTEILAKARSGRYPSSIAEDVSPERLARFFARSGRSYQVISELREMCVFSQHSLIRDPPFSQLDLISCRNLLIYFTAELQRKLLPLLHYALRPGGVLFLGPSEGVGSHPELFEAIEPGSRIFRRRETLTRPLVDFPLVGRSALWGPRLSAPRAGRDLASQTFHQKVGAAFESAVLDDYAMPCALVDARGCLVMVAGRIERYFRLPSGAVSTSLADLVPANLRVELRLAMRSAATTHRKVVRDPVGVELEDGLHQVRLTIRPLPGLDPGSGLYLVALQDHAPLEHPTESAETAIQCEPPALEQLELELRAARTELQTTVEDLEAANEELKSANEELQASQEELQSLNEELETVNAELRQKVEELAATNADLQNLFSSTEIATLFLDRQLRVKRFTPAATALLHLIRTDLGRPLHDLASPIEGADLSEMAQEVLQRLTPIERQVQTIDHSAWLILRLLPYRTLDDRVEGVVITFIDITELKRAEDTLRRATERERFLAQTLEHATTAFGVGAPDGRLILFNRAFAELTGYSREELEDPRLSWMQHLTPPEWREPEMEALARAVLDRSTLSYQKEYLRKDGTRVPIELTVQPVFAEDGALLHYRCFVSDITERKRTQAELDLLSLQRQLALDAAKLGWWYHDPLTQIATWDAGYKRIFGVSDESRPIAEILAQIIHPEDRQRLVSEVAAALDPRDPKPFATQYRINRPDGAMRWVEAHGIASFEGTGRERRATSFVGTVADITDRTRAETALRESEQRLATLIANLPGIAYRCANTPDWPMEFMSEQALALTGYSAQALCSGCVKYGEVIHPEDRTRVWDEVQSAVEAGRSFKVEYRILHADGSERWVWEHGRGVRDDAGRLLAIDGLILDITERRKIEESMRKSELRYRTLVDATSAVTWSCPPSGLQVEAQPSWMEFTGQSLEEMLGQGWMQALHPEDAAEVATRWAAAAARGEPFSHEYRIRRRDGVWRWMSAHAAPIRDSAGRILEWIGMSLDITEQKKAELALREARDTREAILHSMTDGLMIATPTGVVVDINPAAQRMLGFARKEEALLRLTELEALFDVRDLVGAPQPASRRPLARACSGETFTNQELEIRRNDTGQTLIASHGGAAVRDAEGGIGLGIITFRDISDQKRAEARITQLAFYDPLTALPNRRLLEERLASALAQVKRHGGCVAVMVLDLDHFKAINDALGHALGDALLVEVAHRMSACVRATDTVARPGGDEFMLILTGGDADGAAHLAEKVVGRLSEPLRIGGHELIVSCSLGISIAPRDSLVASDLIAHADTAMYRAKQAGRNRYQFFTEEMQREALRAMTLEHQLRLALGGGGLCLHYQPQVELGSGRPIGLEALVRWDHPVRGLLGADQFVPIAETSGLILELSTWVLQTAAEQLQTWSRAGLPLLPVAINLSPQQFRHPEHRRALNAQIGQLITELPFISALLELEITENSLLEKTEETLSTLRELRALGVRLTLDDFGTGYSSLSTLNAFPVDRLKIDQSFVRAAPEYPKQAAIIETILALGRHLEFEVIAEGVETAAQVDQLRRLGCNEAQGYFFARPLPAAEIESWLRRAC